MEVEEGLSPFVLRKFLHFAISLKMEETHLLPN